MDKDLSNWRDPRVASAYIKTVQNFYNQSPGMKITVQLLLSVFATAFFIFFAIRPTLTTITTLLKKIEDQKQVNVKLDTKLAQLTEASQELLKYDEDLPKIEQAIPEEAKMDQFVARIEKLATESQVSLAIQFQSFPLVGTKVNLGNVKEEPKTNATKEANKFVTFSFTVSGSLQTVVKFLNGLERIDRAVSLTKMVLQEPTTQQKKYYTLTAVGRGTIYYLPKDNK
jgi:Tfp pilus assembly protein PilO